MLAPGPPGRYRPKSDTTYVLSWINQQKLQSDLQMAATCAELGGVQERPSCEPRLAAASAGPWGHLVKCTGLAEVRCIISSNFLLDFLDKESHPLQN